MTALKMHARRPGHREVYCGWLHRVYKTPPIVAVGDSNLPEHTRITCDRCRLLKASCPAEVRRYTDDDARTFWRSLDMVQHDTGVEPAHGRTLKPVDSPPLYEQVEPATWSGSTMVDVARGVGRRSHAGDAVWLRAGDGSIQVYYVCPAGRMELATGRRRVRRVL